MGILSMFLFAAAHATIVIAAVGCLIPIFLMWGVCTVS